MTDIHSWFAAYGESHQHPFNKRIHWVCVPTIYFCVVGLLWSIPSPVALPGLFAWIAVGLVALFYLRLSWPIAVGMTLFSLCCLIVARWVDTQAPWPLWSVCLVLFVLAWMGQFWGHRVEGKKPSFLKDLQFLMIGPAWLMGSLFRRWRIAY